MIFRSGCRGGGHPCVAATLNPDGVHCILAWMKPKQSYPLAQRLLLGATLMGTLSGSIAAQAQAAGYRIVYGVATSYLVARLAPDRPMLHALVFGGVGVALSTAGAVATWGRGPEFGPRWYALAIIAIAMPCAWVGGALRGMQSRARAGVYPGVSPTR